MMTSIDEAIERGVKKAFEKPMEILGGRSFNQLLTEFHKGEIVPVVRCKDCKYGEPDTNGFGEEMVMCQNSKNPIGYENWLMPPEFYCADGERRAE